MSDMEREEQDVVEAFYKRHRGGSGAVILVTLFDTEGGKHTGIFSEIGKVNDWIDGFDDGQVFVEPHIVDEPDYGNVPLSRQH